MIKCLELGKNKAVSVAVAVALAAGVCIPVTSAHATSLEEQAAAARAQLDELNAQCEEAAESYDSAVMEYTAAEDKIAEETKKIEENQSKLGKRANSMYRSGSTSFLDYLLGVSSFEEFATTWELLDMLNENDANLISQTKESRAIVEEQKAVAEQKAEEAAVELAKAEEAAQEVQSMLDSLEDEIYQEMLAQEAAANMASLTADDYAALEAAGAINSDGSINYSKASASAGSSDAVSRALAKLGTAYKYGACSPDAFDCSGFVSYCLTGGYDRIGTTATFNSWETSTDPQPGDVVVVHEEGGRQHCGIYLGDGQYVHAPSTGDTVKISAVTSDMKIVHQ